MNNVAEPQTGSRIPANIPLFSRATLYKSVPTADIRRDQDLVPSGLDSTFDRQYPDPWDAAKFRYRTGGDNMKPLGLAVRDGENTAAQGLTASLPCSLAASNIWGFC